MAASILKVIESEAFDAVLGPAGFSRVRRSSCWIREAGGVAMLVGAPVRHDPQWGLYRAELVPALWPDVDPSPPALSKCFVLSRPGNLDHPASVPSFAAADLDDEAARTAVIDGLRRDLAVVVSWLDRFADSRDVWTFLTTTNGNGPFTVPRSRGLDLYTAATLAAADGADEARQLAAEARGAVRDPSTETWKHRFAHLDRLLARR